MAVRPIDGNELVDTLKQIVSDYTSHGMYPSAFPIEYAIEIAEKIPTLTPPNEWVSVEERLPDDNERVIAYRPKEADVSAYKYCVMWGWSVKMSMKHRGISHWMPLPEPPEYRPPEGEV